MIYGYCTVQASNAADFNKYVCQRGGQGYRVINSGTIVQSNGDLGYWAILERILPGEGVPA